MVRAHDENLRRLGLVAERLGELKDEVVFLGGCVAGLLVSEAAAPLVRPTRDVDLIIEVVSRRAFYELEADLASRGFGRPVEQDPPICRWAVEGVTVDVMPIDPAILGFSNPWYPIALQTAEPTWLPSGQPIRVVTAPAFLATKLTAFLDRGEDDFLSSPDLEDILVVIDGRAEIEHEILAADNSLREYLSEEIGKFLSTERFRGALAGHLPPDPASQARLPQLIDKLNRIAG